jgi:hypothetical protein
MRVRERHEIVEKADQGVIQNNHCRSVDDLGQVRARVAIFLERHINFGLLLKLVRA